jgi:hypothetical protein
LRRTPSLFYRCGYLAGYPFRGALDAVGADRAVRPNRLSQSAYNGRLDLSRLHDHDVETFR